MNRAYDSTAIEGLTLQKSFAEKWYTMDSDSTVKVLSSVEDALDYVRRLGVRRGEGEREVHALITGSVHLVGRALGVLEGVNAL